MQLFIKLYLGIAPVALQASDGYVQNFGGFILGKALVIQQIKQGFIQFRKRLDGFVKMFPLEEAARAGGIGGDCS